MIRQLVDFLFPEKCLLCEAFTFRDIALCCLCEKSLPWINEHPYVIDPNKTCPLIYQDSIKKLVQNMKFKHCLASTRILSYCLLKAILQQTSRIPECIIPVPLHSSRLRARGFNQALELGKPIAKALNIPILINTCSRKKNTSPQSMLTASKRKKNLQGAFQKKKTIDYRHIAVIDDVITTGNTMKSLISCIDPSGKLEIKIWCCAISLK